MTDRAPLDSDPVAHVGEQVFFRQSSGPARAAFVANVDKPGGLVDLVVLCGGNSRQTRETWAGGHSVVTFRGLIPHVTQAPGLGAQNWWSRCAEDCPPIVPEPQEPRRAS